MPRLNAQLGIEPVADRPPARGVHLLDVGRIVKNVSRVQRIAIDARPERPQWAERIGRVSGRDVDRNLLRKNRQSERHQHDANIESFQ